MSRRDQRDQRPADRSSGLTDPRGRWDDDGGNSQLWPVEGEGGARALVERDGPHVGHGPHAHCGSALERAVCDAFARHGGLDARQIDVRVQDGEVVLEGQVDDDEQQRLAELVARRVPGVGAVRSELAIARARQVAPPESASGLDSESTHH